MAKLHGQSLMLTEKLFFSYCAEKKIKTKSGKYERPEAEGSVHYNFFVPWQHGKGTVLFAHGGGHDSLFPNLTLFATLLESGYAIFTFDLDGHGLHSSTILDPKTVGSCIFSAQNMVDNLELPKPVHYVGYSLGACLLNHHIQLNPSAKVQSLACIGLPADIPQNPALYLKELALLFSPSFWAELTRWGQGWGREILLFSQAKRLNYPLRTKAQVRGLSGFLSLMGKIIADQSTPLSSKGHTYDGVLDQLAQARRQKFKIETKGHTFSGETHYSSIFCLPLIKALTENLERKQL